MHDPYIFYNNLFFNVQCRMKMLYVIVLQQPYCSVVAAPSCIYCVELSQHWATLLFPPAGG